MQEISQSLEGQIGAHFRKARLTLGLTQANVAARLERSGLNLDPTAITRIEKGKRSLRIEEGVAISHALETTLEDVLKEVAHPEMQVRQLIDGALLQIPRLREEIFDWLLQARLAHVQSQGLDEAIPGVSHDQLLGWLSARVDQDRRAAMSSSVRVDSEEDLEHFALLLDRLTAGLVQILDARSFSEPELEAMESERRQELLRRAEENARQHDQSNGGDCESDPEAP